MKESTMVVLPTFHTPPFHIMLILSIGRIVSSCSSTTTVLSIFRITQFHILLVFSIGRIVSSCSSTTTVLSSTRRMSMQFTIKEGSPGSLSTIVKLIQIGLRIKPIEWLTSTIVTKLPGEPYCMINC